MSKNTSLYRSILYSAFILLDAVKFVKTDPADNGKLSQTSIFSIPSYQIFSVFIFCNNAIIRIASTQCQKILLYTEVCSASFF